MMANTVMAIAVGNININIVMIGMTMIIMVIMTPAVAGGSTALSANAIAVKEKGALRKMAHDRSA